MLFRSNHDQVGNRAQAEVDAAGVVLTLTRAAESGPGVRLVANLTAEVRPFTAPAGWRVLLDSDDPAFAGRGRAALAPHHAVLYEVPA